jgi:hypothetical protein
MSVVIFAGPSLHGADPAALEGFDVRPPAACGDLLAATMTGARAIGLIDGVFDHSPSVWHKEILYALSNGTPVYGAASMGALRGAECAAFGMVGVGRVFEDYASGRRVADADVGVAHAPAEFNFAPMSVALVDIEATLGDIAVRSALPFGSCEALLQAARCIHFKERTWPDVIAVAGFAGEEGEVVETMIETHMRSQKQEDALLLLKRMRDEAGMGPVAKPNFVMAQTGFFVLLHERVAERLAVRR